MKKYTPEQRAKYTAYNRIWREANREKVNQQALDYVNRKRAEDKEGFHKRMCENAKRWRERHLDECRIKEKEKSRIRRNKDKDAYNLEQREYRKKNPEKFSQYYQKRLPKIKEYTKKMLYKKYGLTSETYNQMLLKQEGKCALCEKTFTGQINIDHDHVTGNVRGLLCNHCNTSLGFIEKCIIMFPNILEKITKYLATDSKQIGEALRD
jgi:Skp family chaperone for outer membrane proteins